MASRLERGARWMRDRLPDAAGVKVEVRADATAIIEQLDAIPGRRDILGYLTEDAAGTAETFDWIVREADLLFPLKGKLEPADGWEFRYTREDGRILRFIARPEQSKRVFEVCDPIGLLYRIHTKFDGFAT